MSDPRSAYESALVALNEWRAESDPAGCMPLARKLVGLPKAQREMLFEGISRSGLVQALCELSLEVISDNGELAINTAELAVRCAERLDGERYVRRSLLARSLAAHGYALTRDGRLQEAKTVLDRALETVAPATTCEAVSVGLVYEALGRWHLKGGEPVTAGMCLLAAIDKMQEVGDDHMAGRFRVVYAEAIAAAGDTEHAVGQYVEALGELDLIREPSWGYIIAMHLLHEMLELGNVDAARRYLRAAIRASKGISKAEDKLRLEWVKAKIDAAECNLDRAVWRLETVRDGFADLGRPYEAATAALEAGLIYAEAGEVELLRVSAEDSYRLFAAMGIEPKALAAFGALRAASTVESVRAVQAAVNVTKAAWQAAVTHQAAKTN